MGTVVSLLYHGAVLNFRLLTGKDIAACNAVLVAEPPRFATPERSAQPTVANASLDFPIAVWPDNEPGSPVWDTPEGVPLKLDFDQYE